MEPRREEEIRKALKRLKQKKDKLEREKGKVQPKAEVASEKLKTMGDDRNSYGNTDPDATLMLMKNDSLGVGYNVHMATENQVIVGYGVFQRPNDNHLLCPIIADVEKNLGGTPEVILADKGYRSQSNYEYLQNRGIKGAIPPNTYDYDMAARRKGIYRQSKNVEYEGQNKLCWIFLRPKTAKVSWTTGSTILSRPLGISSTTWASASSSCADCRRWI